MIAYETNGNVITKTELLTEEQWLRKYSLEKRYSLEDAEQKIYEELYYRRKNRNIRKKAREERRKQLRRKSVISKLVASGCFCFAFLIPFVIKDITGCIFPITVGIFCLKGVIYL